MSLFTALPSLYLPLLNPYSFLSFLPILFLVIFSLYFPGNFAKYLVFACLVSMCIKLLKRALVVLYCIMRSLVSLLVAQVSTNLVSIFGFEVASN